MILGTPWRQDGKLYNAAAAARRRPDRGAALQARSAELRRVRREARVRAPARCPGPIAFRGVRLGVMICEDMWTPDATETPGRKRRRAAARHQRLALRARQARRARRTSPCARVTETRPAAALCQPDRRPGRAGVRRRAPSRSTPRASCSVQAPDWREALVMTVLAARRRRRWTVETGRAGAADRGAGGDLSAPWSSACAIMCARTAFPGVVLGLSGGIDSALSAARRGRCAGRRQGPLRDDAVALYLARQPRGRGRGARSCSASSCDTIDIEPAMRGLRRHAGAVLRRARRPTSPRKISSRAPAASR